ncbi:hypothetical protein M3Y99_01583400 [Aphelenchoides fujianensis]|nr:hypothetical protein M3Y99_01583400 [Aphelenchoides fujianensis]
MSPWPQRPSDRKVAALITKMFCNFAACGDPNGSGEQEFEFKWEPATFEHPDRHLLVREQPIMRGAADKGRMDQLSAAFDTFVL